MILIRCDVKDGLFLKDLVPFQGKLKKRTDSDIEALASSIKAEGLLMPFVVWPHEGKNLLLDGHGRRLALEEIAKGDPDVYEKPLPVVFVDADTEEEARKALLQITSSYGKVSKWGVREFTKSIPEYRAPVLDSFRRVPARRRAKGAVNKEADNGEAEIKIMVRRDKVEAVLALFKQVEYIRVCGYAE